MIAKSYSEHLSEFEVALMTGMRQSEQFERTREDIDLNQGMVRLPQTKNGECRFVRLNSRAVTILRAWHDQGIGTGRVFPNPKPRWFTEAVRAASIQDFTWHDLRHTSPAA